MAIFIFSHHAMKYINTNTVTAIKRCTKINREHIDLVKGGMFYDSYI